MLQGVLIFLGGCVLGYILHPTKREILAKEVKKTFTNQKGYVVDMTEPIELEPIENVKEETIK